MRHIRRLDSILEESIGSELVVNDLIYWYAFDTMGDFGFNTDFGQLKKRTWHQGALHMRSAIGLLGPISPAIWIAKIAFAFFPNTWRVKDWFRLVEFAEKCTEERIKVCLGDCIFLGKD